MQCSSYRRIPRRGPGPGRVPAEPRRRRRRAHCAQRHEGGCAARLRNTARTALLPFRIHIHASETRSLPSTWADSRPAHDASTESRRRIAADESSCRGCLRGPVSDSSTAAATAAATTATSMYDGSANDTGNWPPSGRVTRQIQRGDSFDSVYRQQKKQRASAFHRRQSLASSTSAAFMAVPTFT